MAKGSGKSGGRSSSSKGINARYNSNKGNGRPKPMTPKAGYTQTRRRYEHGGSC